MGYMTPVFVGGGGGHWAEWLRNLYILGRPQKDDKIRSGYITPAFSGPRIWRNGYLTPVMSGVPKKGINPQVAA